MTGRLKFWPFRRKWSDGGIHLLRPALGQRATVAIIVGVCAPMLTIAMALGIEVTNWSVTKQRLQRTADAAALAAVESYLVNGNAQTSATYGAYVAELNGAAGSATRTW